MRLLNDMYRDALGLSRAEACALVAIVVAWVYLEKEVTPIEVSQVVERADDSGIAFAGKLVAKLERAGLVLSRVPKHGSLGRRFQPSKRAIRLVLGWAGRSVAA